MARDLKKSDTSAYRAAVTRDTGVRLTDQEDALTAAGALHMMIREGCSLEQCFEDTAARSAQRAQAGADLRAFWEESPRTSEESAVRYGKWFRMAGDALLSQKMPDLDLLNRSDFLQSHSQIMRMKQMASDYLFLINDWKEDPAFRQAFAGSVPWDQEYTDRIYNSLHAVRTFCDQLLQMNDETLPLAQRAASKLIVEQYAGQFRGKSLTEIGEAVYGQELLRQGAVYALELQDLMAVDAQGHEYAEDSDWNRLTGDWLRGDAPRPFQEEGLAAILDTPADTARVGHLRLDALARDGLSPVFDADAAETLFRPSDWSDPAVSRDAAETFDRLFSDTLGKMGSLLLTPEMKAAQITSLTQLFYIDGKPVDEYLKENNLSETEENRKAAVVRACSRAREHVEMAALTAETFDGKEHLVPAVIEVKADLKAFDRMAGFFDRKRSSRAHSLYQDAKGKDERQNAIKENLSRRVLNGISASAAAEAGRYRNDKYSMGDPAVKAAFFGLGGDGEVFDRVEESGTFKMSSRQLPEEQRPLFERLQKLSRMKVTTQTDHSSPVQEVPLLGRELLRGNGGGLTMFAGLIAMSRNPQIRLADLVDSDRFSAEKLQAGGDLLDALEQIQEHPDKIASLIASAAVTLSGLDYRQELLYAVGADPADPQLASEEGVRELMADSGRRTQLMDFSRFLAAYTRGAYQMLGRPFGSTDYQIRFDQGKVLGRDQAGSEPAESPTLMETVYRNVQRHMTEEQREQCGRFRENAVAFNTGQAFRDVSTGETFLHTGVAEPDAYSTVIASYAQTYLEVEQILCGAGKPADWERKGSDGKDQYKAYITEYYDRNRTEAAAVLQEIYKQGGCPAALRSLTSAFERDQQVDFSLRNAASAEPQVEVESPVSTEPQAGAGNPVSTEPQAGSEGPVSSGPQAGSESPVNSEPRTTPEQPVSEPSQESEKPVKRQLGFNRLLQIDEAEKIVKTRPRSNSLPPAPPEKKPLLPGNGRTTEGPRTDPPKKGLKS